MIAKLKQHLLIQSNNPTVKSKGRVALLLILLLMILGFGQLFLKIPEFLQDGWMRADSLSLFFQILAALLIFVIYLFLVRMANHFAKDADMQSILLENRTSQIQKVAAITETRHVTFELNTLIAETIANIQEQFGFYHVSLFLLDEIQEHLVLEGVGGEKDSQFASGTLKLPVKKNSLVGITAVTQKPNLAQNTDQKSPHWVTIQQKETQSELALPLIAHNNLLGVLDIQSQEPDTFQPEEIAILQILANQMAVNIDNTRLFAQTEKRLNETRALYDFNLYLSDTNDLGEIYRRSAREFATQLNGVRSVACLLDPSKEQLITQADYWHIKDGIIVETFQPDTPIYELSEFKQTQKVLQNQEPLIYKENLPDTAIEQECLEVALVHHGNSLGVIRVYRNLTQPLFHLAEIQLAQAMANQMAVSLSNTNLTAEAQGRVAQLSTLYRMSLVLSEANTLKGVFDGARREILSLIEASGMSIVLINPDNQTLNWIYAYEYGQEIDLTNVPSLPIEQGFSGHVYKTGEVLHVTKDSTNLEQYNTIIIGADLNSWLGLPMVVANKVIGVLAVESEDHFSERDIELLKTIVGPLAIGINNLIQFEAIESALAIQSVQRLHLQTAAEIAATAASVLNQTQLINEAVELIKDRFQLYYVGIFLVDAKQRYAILQAGSGEEGRLQLNEEHALLIGGRSLIGGATRDGVPRIIQNVTSEEEWLPNPFLPDTRSELALPLHVRNKVIGALTVQSKKSDLFTPEMVRTLQTMSDQLAIAIENAQLLNQAEERAERQQYINQVSAKLHQSSNVEEIISVGLKALSSYLDDSAVDLYLGRKHNTQTKPLNGKNTSA